MKGSGEGRLTSTAPLRVCSGVDSCGQGWRKEGGRFGGVNQQERSRGALHPLQLSLGVGGLSLCGSEHYEEWVARAQTRPHQLRTLKRHTLGPEEGLNEPWKTEQLGKELTLEGTSALTEAHNTTEKHEASETTTHQDTRKPPSWRPKVL